MDDNTFPQNVLQQSRIIKYIRDIINNWFSDPINIRDQRLRRQLFDNDQLKRGTIKIGTSFNDSNQFIGTTPDISVSLGDIIYQHPAINTIGNNAFASNPTLAPALNIHNKTIPIAITITTQSYDATMLLTQLLQLFIVANIDIIREDCAMLDTLRMHKITAPIPVQPGQAANARQLYKSVIQLVTVGHVMNAIDTQGPIFNGLQFTNNF